MPSRRTVEGWLQIDHRDSPGIGPNDIWNNPLRQGHNFEAGIMLCKHCQRQIVRNPERVRERAVCHACDSYICDWCELERRQPDYVHETFEQKADKALNAAAKGKEKPPIILSGTEA